MDNLSKISYILFAISLVALFIITRYYEPKEYSIRDAHDLDLESFATISGTVESAKVSGKNIILKISEMNYMTAFGNAEPRMNYSSLTGKKITIKGKITEYNGEREIDIYDYSVS